MPRKQRKNMKRKPRTPRRTRDVSEGKEFRGDQHTICSFPITPFQLSTTVTTGVIANAYAFDPTGNTSPDLTIKNWSTRCTAFQEYRIRSVTVRARPLTTTTGVSRMFFNRLTPTTPTQTIAESEPGMTVSHAQANSRAIVSQKWVNRDFQGLSWQPVINSPLSVTQWNIYTDAALYGAPATATPLWLVDGNMVVEFRGRA